MMKISDLRNSKAFQYMAGIDYSSHSQAAKKAMFARRVAGGFNRGAIFDDALADFGFGTFGLLNPWATNIGSRNLGLNMARAMKYNGPVAAGAAGFKTLTRGLSQASWGERAMFGASTLGKGIPLALTAMGAVQGYRSGGVIGAAKGVAVNTMITFAMSAGLRAAASIGGAAVAVAAPLAITAAAGYGTYKALEFGNARIKRARRLNMGHAIMDPFGNGATMRQRSLQALQMSQVNGRSAFGREGEMMHLPYLR